MMYITLLPTRQVIDFQLNTNEIHQRHSLLITSGKYLLFNYKNCHLTIFVKLGHIS